jgi:hypothetical protein
MIVIDQKFMDRVLALPKRYRARLQNVLLNENLVTPALVKAAILNWRLNPKSVGIGRNYGAKSHLLLCKLLKIKPPEATNYYSLERGDVPKPR